MSLPIGVALIGLLVGSSAIGILSGHIAVPRSPRSSRSCSGSASASTTRCSSWPGTGRTSTTGMPVPEAVGRANATAGLSVLFAGITVVVAIAGLQVAGIPMMTTMGWGSALMVAITMLAAVTLLPGAARAGRPQVNSLRVPFVRPKPANAPTPGRPGGQPRWSPARSATAVVAAVLLGVLAAPAFALRLGFADDGNDGAVHDAAQVLRPARRGLRPRLQRPAPGRRRGRRLARTTRRRCATRHGVWPPTGRRLGRRAGV